MTKSYDVLLGTIIGDISGSRFEILNTKNRDFEFFHKNCRFTDDSVMTLAIAKAFLKSNNDYSNLEKNVIDSMVELGRKYPKCGYGPSFRHWIMSDEHKPYGSFGNGAAMRISSVGVVAKDINEIKRLSAIITNVSHNHKDSIDGSEATAVAIHMALNGKSKDDIKEYINNNYFGIYDLRKDSMKPQIFHINCVETVKQSIGAFLDSNDFEDAIRNAIVLGGDSDTIAAITGGIAAAYYGIPDNIYNKALEYLDDYLIEQLANSPYSTAALLSLYALMKTDRMTFEFMNEVIKDKIELMNYRLTDIELNQFILCKAQQSELVAKWKDSNKIQVKSALRKIITDAGIIRDLGSVLMIMPPILDKQIYNHIVELGDKKYLEAMGV